MKPSDPLEQYFRLTRTQLFALKRLGVNSIGDLLRHFPTRYEEAGASVRVSELKPGEKVTLAGTLTGLKPKKLWKSKRNVTEGWFEDGSGRVKVMWFNQPYIASYVQQGVGVQVSGIVGGKEGNPYIANPKVEHLPPGVVHAGIFSEERGPSGIFPVYPESKGITSRWFYHALTRVFAGNVHEHLNDPIPSAIRDRYHLPDLARSLVALHRPEKGSHAEAARKRFAFEEIFAIQTAKAMERAENQTLVSFPILDGATLAEKFLASTLLSPTNAQRRAIADIIGDFEKPHPMARLLEGDVGSGKTLVAAATAYAVVNSRPPGRSAGTLQVAYMAPTEILASQHFQSFVHYFSHLPINIALITGSGCKKFPSKASKGQATDISRSQLLKWVQNGEIAMLVGTHALIQKSVKFQHLAYAIVDEQHRFGTRQRLLLSQKNSLPAPSSLQARSGSASEACLSEASSAGRTLAKRMPSPHFLSMTATPIPRTLALTMYGDLDISLLDELPPGRARITTVLVKPEERESAYEAIRKELEKGRQAYVICPRIEEPDPAKINAVQAKSAKAEAQRLKKEVFPEFEIGLLHGAMKPREKDDVMRRFDIGKIHILVATSVVEVGINVPNATIILIEGAERFGLAQLHQLRGRVQRSSHPPRCYLLPETSGKASRERLKALETSDNGFYLAETDLLARGSGDLYGRRQWGVSDLGMDALKNAKLIKAARDEARALVASDPSLLAYPALRERIEAVSNELHRE